MYKAHYNDIGCSKGLRVYILQKNKLTLLIVALDLYLVLAFHSIFWTVKFIFFIHISTFNWFFNFVSLFNSCYFLLFVVIWPVSNEGQCQPVLPVDLWKLQVTEAVQLTKRLSQAMSLALVYSMLELDPGHFYFHIQKAIVVTAQSLQTIKLFWLSYHSVLTHCCPQFRRFQWT